MAKHTFQHYEIKGQNHYVRSVKYGVFSDPYFPAFGLNRRDTSYLSIFSPNARKYGPEKTPYLDTFHTVSSFEFLNQILIL